MDLRINNDYFSIQHYLTGFYNRDGDVYLAVQAQSLITVQVKLSLQSLSVWTRNTAR